MTAYNAGGAQEIGYSNVAVFAEGISRDASAVLEAEICKVMAPTPCVAGSTLVAVANSKSARQDAVAETNVESILQVSFTPTSASYTPVSENRSYENLTPEYANAAGYRSNYRSRNVYSDIGRPETGRNLSETAVPRNRGSRTAVGTVLLRDAQTGGVAWRGEIHTLSGGAALENDRTFFNATSKDIVGELQAAGFFQP